MTKERRIELTKYRHQIATQDQQREIAGQLLDGIKQDYKGKESSC